jgi:hypothetical protein
MKAPTETFLKQLGFYPEEDKSNREYAELIYEACGLCGSERDSKFLKLVTKDNSIVIFTLYFDGKLYTRLPEDNNKEMLSYRQRIQRMLERRGFAAVDFTLLKETLEVRRGDHTIN